MTKKEKYCDFCGNRITSKNDYHSYLGKVPDWEVDRFYSGYVLVRRKFGIILMCCNCKKNLKKLSKIGNL